MLHILILIKNFLFSRHYRKMRDNVGWIVFYRIALLPIGVLTLSFTARYLKPEGLGILNFSAAFVALFAVFSTLELNQLTVRELRNHPDQSAEIMGTSFLLKIAGGFLAFFLAVIGVMILRPNDHVIYNLVVIMAAAYFFQCFDVIAYWFQAEIRSKYLTLVGVVNSLLVSVLQIVLVLIDASLLTFGLVSVLGAGFMAVGLLAVYKRNGQHILSWRFNRHLAASLIKECLPLIVSGLAITVYMRADQVILKYFAGAWAVGIFVIAVRISELCYVLPVAITETIFPRIVDARRFGRDLYLQKLQLLYALLTWLTIGTALILTFLSGPIVRFLFGLEYADSVGVIMVHIWTLPIVALGLATGQHLIVEKLTKVWLWRSVAGAVFCIGSNLLLVPRYGAMGAAFSVLIGQAVSVFSIVFTKSCRDQIRLLINIFNFKHVRFIARDIVKI